MRVFTHSSLTLEPTLSCQQTRTLRWSGALLGSRPVDWTSVIAAAESWKEKSQQACDSEETTKQFKTKMASAIRNYVVKTSGFKIMEI
jgi:hypothetical protein